MPKILIVFVIYISLMHPSKSHAQESEIIFEGIPTKMIVSGLDVNKETHLTNQQKNKSRVLITKRGKDYFWASREDKQLIPTVSGIYLFFIAPGSGYVKISTATNEYIEHMSLGLATFTYWGNTVKLDLK